MSSLLYSIQPLQLINFQLYVKGSTGTLRGTSVSLIKQEKNGTKPLNVKGNAGRLYISSFKI